MTPNSIFRVLAWGSGLNRGQELCVTKQTWSSEVFPTANPSLSWSSFFCTMAWDVMRTAWSLRHILLWLASGSTFSFWKTAAELPINWRLLLKYPDRQRGGHKSVYFHTKKVTEKLEFSVSLQLELKIPEAVSRGCRGSAEFPHQPVELGDWSWGPTSEVCT